MYTRVCKCVWCVCAGASVYGVCVQVQVCKCVWCVCAGASVQVCMVCVHVQVCKCVQCVCVHVKVCKYMCTGVNKHVYVHVFVSLCAHILYMYMCVPCTYLLI